MGNDSSSRCVLTPALALEYEWIGCSSFELLEGLSGSWTTFPLDDGLFGQIKFADEHFIVNDFGLKF